MAVNGNVLALLLRNRMHDKFKLVMDYNGPLLQSNPSYYMNMCDAIGKGVVDATPSIQFVTADAGVVGTPPRPGTGIGQGIILDVNWFTRKLYTSLRAKFIGQYGSTSHPVWCDGWDQFGTVENPLPVNHCSLHPNHMNPYNFLTAMCEAISECVSEHYAQFRVLNSTHTMVYSGVGNIQEGGFIGVDSNLVSSTIQGLGTAMQGSAWPSICQAIGESYAEAIMQHSTGEVVITGVCVPSQSQTCGVPGVGVGSGAAT